MCDLATRGESGREVQKPHHSEDKQVTTLESNTPDWIQETIKATETDHRKQPWREAFTEAVDSRFDDKEDLVRVEPAIGVDLDPSCLLILTSWKLRKHSMENAGISPTLKFLKWQKLYEAEKPFQIFINIPPHVKDQRTTNLVYENVQVDIKDARDYESSFNLDKQGFTYLKHTTNVQDFEQRAVVEEEYLPEIEQLIRSNMQGVDRVHFFDWRLRKNAPEIEGSIIDLNDLTNWLRPAMHVHVDQSPTAVLRRIQLQLKEDARFLLQGRIRVINVWRPLINAVQDWPLAICDGSTVSRSDLVEADHIRRHYMGSTMYLQHNPNQQFYYMSNQTKEDVLMFKNFDSDRTTRAQCEVI